MTGIWQTVWIEPVPRTYIRGLKILPDIDQKRALIEVDVAGDAVGYHFTAVAQRNWMSRNKARGGVHQPLDLAIKNPVLLFCK